MPTSRGPIRGLPASVNRRVVGSSTTEAASLSDHSPLDAAYLLVNEAPALCATRLRSLTWAAPSVGFVHGALAGTIATRFLNTAGEHFTSGNRQWCWMKVVGTSDRRSDGRGRNGRPRPAEPARRGSAPRTVESSVYWSVHPNRHQI
jgi:hypothetical protein